MGSFCLIKIEKYLPLNLRLQIIEHEALANDFFMNENMRGQEIHSTYLNSYWVTKTTVLPAKSDSDIMFCLQSFQGLRIDRSLVY